MKHKTRLILWALISVFIMAAIFSFSAQDAESSKELSGSLLLKIKVLVDLLPDIFGGSDGNKIRKYAHLFEFMCLGGSGFMFFSELYYLQRGRIGRAFLSTLMFGLVNALTDEVHQIFVPGRACQLRDILIDFVGVLLAAAALGAVYTLTIKKREQKDE